MAQASRPLWEFIPIDHYARPTEPTTEVVRKGIRGAWDRLRQHSPPEKPLIADAELSQVPEDRLQQAAPLPAWDDAVSALSAALEHWLTAPEPASSVQVLVGPPFAGLLEVATHWAHAHQWRLVTPPLPAQVLEGGGDWFSALESDDKTPLVMPSLEGCYLRHHDGLALIRRLIDWVCTHRLRCLLGCNSWAWAYLRRALEVDVVFPPPLTLQGFDEERLQRWFRSLALGADGAEFTFLQANSGKPVLNRVDQGAGPGKNEPRPPKTSKSDRSHRVTDFLKYVAGRSRGNSGVAWTIWRRSLHLAVRDEAPETEIPTDSRVLWVKPWSQMDLPYCPSRLSQTGLLVLHALLLHGGLATEILPQLLPFTTSEIMQSLHELRAREILHEAQDRWQVTPLGYPAVRPILESEGYLTDQF
jgi:hypothetical protein